MKNPNIEAWSAPKPHDRVLALLTKETPGKVLDIGCSPGAMSYALSQLGFDVRACDMHPENFQVKDIPCDHIDLNQGLSIYNSESFDFATCCDVLEHENHFLLIREIGRILKSGGKMIFTTPNIAHLQARIFFCLHSIFLALKTETFPSDILTPSI